MRRLTSPYLGSLIFVLGSAGFGWVGCSAPGGEAPPLNSTNQPVERFLGLSDSSPSAPLTLFDFTNRNSEVPVQAYLVLTERAPAESIPWGTDIRTSASVKHRYATQLQKVREQQQRVAPAVESSGAQLIAHIEKVGNALHIMAPLSVVERLSRLADVDRVEPVPIFSRSLGVATPAVGAPQLWQRALSLDGAGISVGIMDSGVDYLHADFGGPGTRAAFTANDSTLIEAGSFPTARVVGGYDFAGDAYTGGNSPVRDPDPLDCARQVGGQISGGHGTHVAGIAAGNGVLSDGSAYLGPYNVSLDPEDFLIFPGVAPKADIYAIRIFGCTGGTGLTASAYDYAMDPNDDGDPSDRLDVLNASLGSDFGIGLGFQGQLVENLTRGGTVFVAAAGNAGSSFFITGQPASYPHAISVAATSESALPRLRVLSPAGIAGDYAAVAGGRSLEIPTDNAITGRIVRAQPNNGCSSLTNAAAISGNIALIDRGSCTFDVKLSQALQSGAKAAIIVQNTASEPPFPMGGETTVAIPAVMISQADGELLKASGEEIQVELLAIDGVSQLSPFSSRGPEGLKSNFKPDIAAPGGGIRSAGVGSGFEAVTNSGTSMASPMAAGAAALIKQANPSWFPAEVKAALTTTGAPSYVSGIVAPTSLVGGGRIQVEQAVDTQVIVAAEPSEGSGVAFEPLIVSKPSTTSRTVRVSNKGAAPVEFDLAAELTYELPGVAVEATQSSIRVEGNSSAEFELVLSFDPSQMTEPAPDPVTPAKVRFSSEAEYGRHFIVETSGALRLSSKTAGQGDLSLPFNGAVRPAGERELEFERCGAGDALSLKATGETAVTRPVVGLFELGELTQPNPSIDPAVDIVAVGASSDLKTRSFEEASLFVAFATAGAWTTPAPNNFQGLQAGYPGRYVVQIDTDLNGAYDYQIVALSFEDVLISYSLSNTNRRGEGRFVNIVPASELNTNAYHNNVLAVPVFFKDLGLTEGSTQIAYRVVTIADNLTLADSTRWIRFDASKPLVDASPYGYNGRPIFGVGDKLQVDVVRDEEPELLALHFDNAPGARLQVLSIPGPHADETNLAITGSAPAEVQAGELVTWSVRVEHQAQTDQPSEGAAARLARLALSVEGASLVQATPSKGVCSAAARSCDLGELAVGESADIELSLRILDDAAEANLVASLTSDEGCGAVASDDSVQLAATINGGSAGGAAEGVYPAGGCACRVAPEPASRLRSLGAWLSAGLGLGLVGWRRRQRRS